MARDQESSNGSLSPIWLTYKNALQRVQQFLSGILGAWGAFVARHPLRVLLVSLAVALACLPGLLLQPRLYKTELNDVWVDKTSKSFKDYQYVDPNYPSVKYAATITLDAKNIEKNVLASEVVLESLQVHEAAMAVKVEYNGREYSYPDLCYRLENGWCDQNGFLSFWNFSSSFYQEMLVGFPTAQAAIVAAVNMSRWPDGREVVQLAVFSDNLRYSDNSDDVLVGATTSRWAYLMAMDLDTKLGKTWARAYTKAMRAIEKDLKYIRIYHQHTWASDDEVNNQVSGNLPLMGACVLIICIWALGVFSRRGCRNTRTSLGLLAFITVLLGTAAGYGFSLYCQIIFAMLQLFALPFIMLALGIDMTFVVLAGITEAIERHGDGVPLEVLFDSALRACGLSITTTTLASVFAFALGATSKIPAIKAFCGNAALCLIMVYLMTLTFFVAAAVLTERRVRARKLDCCCCYAGNGCASCDNSGDASSRNAESEAESGKSRPSSPPSIQMASKLPESAPARLPGSPPPPARTAGFSTFFGDVYGRYLTTPLGAIIALGVFAGWVAMSIWAINRVEQGLPNQDLLPDSSYLQPLIKRLDQTFFRTAGADSGLYFRDMDFSKPSTQRKMNQAWDYAKHYRDFSLKQSPKTSWLTALADLVEATRPELVDRSDPTGPVINADQATFDAFLKEFFTNNKTEMFSDRLVMSGGEDKSGKILGCKFGLVHRPSRDYSDTGDFLESARKAEMEILKRFFAEERKGAPRDVALIFGSDYTFWQLSYHQLQLLWEELGFAFLGATILMLVMLVHPLPALIVVAAVVCVVVCLFGELYVFGLRLNPISAINMLMAVGLSIDYVLYATHKFLMKPGSNRRERVMHALHDIGAAVFLGATSTICGMAPLLLGTSAVLRYFAYLMIGTVIFGVIAGLAVVPVLMWLFGPEQCIEDGWSAGHEAARAPVLQVEAVSPPVGWQDAAAIITVQAGTPTRRSNEIA